ncbi:zinc-dependent alcohol dehydrogenase [Aestuariibaculum sediminum]|uniref:Zinc-binding dehydrogenase n=1 Tax=Aestuariibaculum sediminum TaxID=2770637 RepID=A0A8J6Q0R5_9FLAO|nr:zinc-binding dehydrogenase [Aestuariibaculum sediminum]MBD0833438.1 zinc-binding dehydrogenase [Aestuariibaculum sediminum]
MKGKNTSGVFQGIHDIRVEEREQPTITNDSVILNVEATGICGTDLHIYHEGLVPSGSVLGHEFCGELVEVGAEVKDLKVGDRVVVNPMYNGVGLGLSPGGFANQVRIVNAQLGKNILKIPESITTDKGALLEPLTVGLAAINKTDMSAADNVLVSGCGTIGLVTIAALKSKGIENIIATDISEKRLELAKTLGAKYTFNPSTDGDLKDFIVKQYGEVNALDYSGMLPNLTTVFECTGVSALFTQCLDLLAPDGKMTVLAIYSKETTMNPNSVVYKRLNVQGSLFYTDEDFLEAISLVETGKVDVTPIITHHFPLDELPKAFEVQADSGQSVKVVVTCN